MSKNTSLYDVLALGAAWLLSPLPNHPELFGIDLVAMALHEKRILATPCPECKAPAGAPCGVDHAANPTLNVST